MLGVVVNALAVLFGGLIGFLCRKILPKKIEKAVMTGIALCILYIGISGLAAGKNMLVTILSVVFGAILGTLADLDALLTRFGEWATSRFKGKSEDGKQTLSEAFVYGTLIFCVGAMAITGGLDAGLTGNNSIFYAKAVLDGISAVFFAASLGIGIMLSAASVFVYQSAIVLLAGVIKPLLTDAVIAEMSCIGSLLLIVLALNLLGLTKIKLMNYIPAVFLPILFCLFL